MEIVPLTHISNNINEDICVNTNEDDYDNINECRICLMGGDEDLISPCNCCGTQKYVHQSCLNRWREENINNEKYYSCEICKREFKILNNYKPETLMYRSEFKIPCPVVLYVLFNYFFGGVIWSFDLVDNYKSLNIITLWTQDTNFSNFLNNDPETVIYFSDVASCYYTGFSIFSISMIHLLIHFCFVLFYIHRKATYFKNFYIFLFFYFISSLNIYIGYLSYIIFQDKFGFIFTLGISSINNYLNIYRILKKHNDIVIIMNKEIKNQIILSLNDNEISLNNNSIYHINDETNNIRIEISTDLNSYSSLDQESESGSGVETESS